MRLGFVVPRYGARVVGGAERLCRQYAERLAARDHEIEVFSTCAIDHFTWKNVLPAGTSVDHGVRVHRFRVTHSKDLALVAGIEQRIHDLGDLDSVAELAWMMNAGASEPLLDAIDSAADRLDALIFMPYLFATTCFGARLRPDKSLIIPCLHDEPYARFGIVQETLRMVQGLIFNSAGEKQLAAELLHRLPSSCVVGAGFDVRERGETMLTRLPRRVPDEYVIYAGRREVGKNWPLLAAWMTMYSRALSRSGPLPLLTIGSGSIALPPVAAQLVIDLGYVDEAAKHEILRNAMVTAQLSLNESFSYAIFESWLALTPVVVHRDCPVTRGFCEESEGGLWAGDEEEFAVILDELRGNQALRRRLGENGQKFATNHFAWPAVLERLEAGIRDLIN